MKKTDKKEKRNLDEERIENSKFRLARVIENLRGGDDFFNEVTFGDGKLPGPEAVEEWRKKLCAAIGLLDVSVQETRWACESENWNDEVAFVMEDAVKSLGLALADIINGWNEEGEETYVGCLIEEALVKLSSALAALASWFDESEKTPSGEKN